MMLSRDYAIPNTNLHLLKSCFLANTFDVRISSQNHVASIGHHQNTSVV